MNPINHIQVAVVGAGALGAASALALARAGARVTVVEAAPPGRNASGVAAGMLAPAMESVLDRVSLGRYGRLAAARDLWPQFIDGLGPTGITQCGAILKAAPETIDEAMKALVGQGARAQRLGDEALFTPEDWRLEPRLALAAMLEGVQSRGGELRRGRVAGVESGGLLLEDGDVVSADVTVLACGFGGLHLAPELAVLEPIKGQILRFPDVELSDGPILRGPGGYVVPSRDGPVCGATMEAGLDDVRIDAEAVERLSAQAVRLAPQLAGARAAPTAGVRATTPDGLPLVGRSGRDGVWLAAGARRDGWLIAPMVAQSLVRQIVHGDAPDPGFDPARFAS